MRSTRHVLKGPAALMLEKLSCVATYSLPAGWKQPFQNSIGEGGVISDKIYFCDSSEMKNEELPTLCAKLLIAL